MNIQLSEHFNYKKLLKFTIPSIAMMIFTSIYGVVDGYFVSNFVGKTSFAAVNFIMPFLMLLGALGFMFGTGGSALVARSMGEGDENKARRLFSLFVYTSIILGAVISLLGIIFLRPIAAFLGAEGELLDQCVIYGRIILYANVPFILQLEFQTFFITAERPQLGLFVTVLSGIANMILDYLLVAVFRFGIEGAAWATGISQFVGGIIPLIYFSGNTKNKLRLVKTSYDQKALLKCCTNGSSELMSNISMSLVGMLYNVQLLKYAGENGVAAYGVLMYVNFVFISAFIGYSIGTAPIISYHFGADNSTELKSLLKKSFVIIGIFSSVMFLVAEVLALPLASIFASYDEELLDLTVRGFRIFSFSFLFAGIAIFGSGFFTALNNGLISAVMSFMRTLVFQVAAVIILPLIFKIDGIWASVVVAELMAFAVTMYFIVKMRKKYRY